MSLTPEQKAKIREIIDLAADPVSFASKIVDLETALEEKFSSAVEAVNTLVDVVEKLNGRVDTALPSGDQRYFTDTELANIKQDILSQISIPTIDESKIISTAVEATLSVVKKLVGKQKEVTVDYVKVAAEVAQLLPNTESKVVELKTVETVKEVVDGTLTEKVSSLEEEIKKTLKRFDKFETNVQNIIGSTRSGGPGGTNVRILNNGVPVGDTVSEINFTNATSIEYTGGATGRRVNVTTASGGGGSGTFGIISYTGTVNGSNTSFTFSSAPVILYIDHVPYQKTSSDGTVNWTGTTSVTLTIAPINDLFGV